VTQVKEARPEPIKAAEPKTTKQAEAPKVVAEVKPQKTQVDLNDPLKYAVLTEHLSKKQVEKNKRMSKQLADDGDDLDEHFVFDD